MATFANAVINQEARTANGMKARKSTASAVVDLFYNAGASRGKNIVPAFTAAYVENKNGIKTTTKIPIIIFDLTDLFSFLCMTEVYRLIIHSSH